MDTPEKPDSGIAETLEATRVSAGTAGALAAGLLAKACRQIPVARERAVHGDRPGAGTRPGETVGIPGESRTRARAGGCFSRWGAVLRRPGEPDGLRATRSYRKRDYRKPPRPPTLATGAARGFRGPASKREPRFSQKSTGRTRSGTREECRGGVGACNPAGGRSSGCSREIAEFRFYPPQSDPRSAALLKGACYRLSG